MLAASIILISVFIAGMGCGWGVCIHQINKLINEVEEAKRLDRVKQFSRNPNE